MVAALSVLPMVAHGEVANARMNAPGMASSGTVSEVVKEGLRLYYQGDYQGAAGLFSAAISANPNDMAARYYLGYAHYRMGEFERARKNFEGAYLIDPTFTPVPPERHARQ